MRSITPLILSVIGLAWCGLSEAASRDDWSLPFGDDGNVTHSPMTPSESGSSENTPAPTPAPHELLSWFDFALLCAVAVCTMYVCISVTAQACTATDDLWTMVGNALAPCASCARRVHATLIRANESRRARYAPLDFTDDIDEPEQELPPPGLATTRGFTSARRTPRNEQNDVNDLVFD